MTSKGQLHFHHLNLSDTLRSFCLTYYVVFNVILCAFYKLNGGKLMFFLISFIKLV